jgi:HK97 gp10 family phage protein
MEINVELKGFDVLEQRLKSEPPKVARKVLRRAARDAGDIWVTAISDNAPELTGYLRANIGENTHASTAGIEVVVGPGKKAFYAIFQEFGTRFQGAKPFVRPAFESTKDLVLDTFVEDLNDELNALKG